MFWSRKKRVDVKTFTSVTFQQVMSDDYENASRALLLACGPPFSELVSRSEHLLFLRAAALQLFMAATVRSNARSSYYDISFALIALMRAHDETGRLERLKREFNSAFGSSATDGIQEMAKLFVTSLARMPTPLLTAEAIDFIAETTEAHRMLLVDIYKAQAKALGQVRII